MNELGFRNWLLEEGRPLATIQNRISNCKNVERYEGDLDNHYDNDLGESLIEKLSYSTNDEQNNNQPRHRIPINGNIRNGSATLKQAVTLYFSYREANGGVSDDIEIDEISNVIREEKIELYNNFSYEADLKNSLVKQIDLLFPNYSIFGINNEGVEFQIEGKRIDILLEKNDGSLLAIELKSGTANYKVLGQILLYLGLLSKKFENKKIEGLIIAGEIDNTLIDACSTTNNVFLKKYKMKIELSDDI